MPALAIEHALRSVEVDRPSQEQDGIGPINQLVFVFPGKGITESASSLLNEMGILK